MDPSVYVRFPLTSGPLAGEAALLVWTTTPWTLVSNTAVAAHPGVTYVVARRTGDPDSEKLVVAEPLLEKSLGEGWEATGQTFTGKEMERWTYERPFSLVEFPEPAHYVVNAEYVTTEDGTGLVHQSPAFGADDLAVCRAYGLPVVNPVRPDGTFEEDVPLVGGVFFKKADEKLTADLDARGLLFKHIAYEHSYPHCWRCHTALLYYAQPSWYIRTTAVKDAMLRENEKTNWFPDSVKQGRFGDWLNNNIDWALSRNRYWGTPLPIWRCEEDHLTCVGSRAELSELSGTDQSALDPHRPYIDDVTFPCTHEGCSLTAVRVPEVIDAWYDSGSMPFAQWGYPYKNKEIFEKRYPAQFISEAIDQTRGWFYTMMAVGTLVFDKSSYENVVCLGHILAEDGRKMSKHLGNILQPIPLMDQHGADAVRWFMAAGGSPWAARRVGHGTIQEVVRKTLLTYWNTVAFQALYARTSNWAPSAADPAPADRTVLDRWLLSELHTLVAEVTEAMESYDTQRAGKLLSSFVDDLSNWYVRRSRRRFWQGDASALRTLHDVVETVTRLMAPPHPLHHGAGVAGHGRPGGPGRPGVGAPVVLAGAGRRAGGPRAVPGHAAGAAPGRAGPRDARGVGRQDPPAAVARAGRRGGLRRAVAGAAVPDHGGAERLLPGLALRGRRVPGGHDREGELPGAGQAVRQGRAGRGEGGGRGRRCGAVPVPAGRLRRGRGERRGRDPDPGRGHHHRDPARGLVGGLRLGRDGRAGPGDHPGAAAGGPGP
ncbi:hypothetical protein GCM10020254_60680 [Streptomyces goshikiensis]